MKLEIFPEHVEEMKQALQTFYTMSNLHPMISNTPYGYQVIVNISDLLKEDVELVVYSILSKHEFLLESPCKFTIINGHDKLDFEIDVC